MKYLNKDKFALRLILGMGALTIAALVAACTTSSAPQPVCAATIMVNLRAEATTMTMPDGRVVPMWGFAKDTRFGALDGTVSVPGPEIKLCGLTDTLIVMLDNNLPVPTSVVINGQQSDMTPVRLPNGRVSSFTPETPPGNVRPGMYTFRNLRAGAFLYQSGTHQAVQEQMGLYGAMTKDYATNTAYPGVGYTVSSTVVYSEVDPDLHDAVATGNYGPGLAVTSTVNFHPKYLLLNGDPNLRNGFKFPPFAPGVTMLIRFINAGIASHSPMFAGIYANVVAEDGFPYNHPKNRYSLLLTAGKTMDALISVPAGGTVSFVPDRIISHM